MTRRLFDVRSVALARIPLLPVPAGEPEPGTGPLLREAVFLASRQAWTDAEGSAAEGSRASATLRSYELRARWRPVPNGAFAAATPARVGSEKTVLRLGGDGHCARTVPSGTWLSCVAGQLAEDPHVLACVQLTTADLAVRRGRRFEIERPAAPDEAGPRRTSVNATAATELILLMCAGGSDATSLVALAREKWPDVPEATIRAAITGLVQHGLLLTDLLPADLWNDPLGHLLGCLPPRHPRREDLERLRSLLTEADRHRPGDPSRLAALLAARQKADQICGQQRPLSVNIVADTCLELPQSVADAAADAATMLWRIGDREDPLDGYHRRFVERYGRRRLVPFTELCDPGLGLGLDPREEEGSRRPSREQALARLIARAATTGAVAVTLDDGDVTALAHDRGLPPPRTAEIWVRILAGTQADRDEGRFFLAVSGGSQDAGSTAGRFADLRRFLPGDSDEEGALVTELVVNARTPQAAALAPPVSREGQRERADPAITQALAARAASWLSRQARCITDDLDRRRRDGDPYMRRAVYDTISGLAGIGRVLLAAVTDDQPAAEPGLIRALETLTRMIMTQHGCRPGWWLPAELHPPAVKADPSGSAATGMAHGIAGPLAFLSVACARGWAVPGQYDAIRHVSQWLLGCRADGAWQWPTSVTGSELDTSAARLTGRQDAWCYGAPGISAALGLAAQALGDVTLAEASEAAMNALAARAARTWDADGPTLCHGHAGVLQCAANRHPHVASAAADAITAAFDAGRPFAVPHTGNGAIEDHPGFLIGAAGTALALAELGRLPARSVPDRWDCVLLLS
ncbi:lantibiotic dehydratase [Sphaerisporangium sp. NPDC051017]|uniref:lantibiotic dehydratase n=1 Tax=Sphaerisporangium sp. NPDC051017 TaxID=3154636 RepID=UPI00343490F9